MGGLHQETTWGDYIRKCIGRPNLPGNLPGNLSGNLPGNLPGNRDGNHMGNCLGNCNNITSEYDDRPYGVTHTVQDRQKLTKKTSRDMPH